MTETTLFVMAGYRGAGKSTLLYNALSRDLPVFGRELDPKFRSTRLPSRFPEWSLTADEVLREQTWFSTRHVQFLTTLEPLPENVVVHIDLVSVVSSKEAHYCPGDPVADEVRRLVPRSVRDLTEDSRNRALFALFLSSRLFRRFDRIAINTLHVPWKAAAAQWHASRKTVTEATANMAAVLFAHEHPGAAIHGSIYRSWLSAVDAIQPELSLLSEFRDGELVIDTIGGRT